MRSNQPTTSIWSRRALLRASAGCGLAVAAVGGAARLAQSGDGRGADPALLLSGDADSNIKALDVALGDGLLKEVAPSHWQSRALSTSTHSMIGVTWRSRSPSPVVRIRSRAGRTWGPWRVLPTLQDRPDLGAGEATTVSGTDLAWVGEANGIQVDVAGTLPPGLTLVLMHPVRTADPGPPGGTATAALYGAGILRKLRPQIYYRRAWGADESWRSGDPSYNHTIKQVHVHHTVNSNGYGRGDVPGLIRGIYRYHTKSLGWSDIGYNFLVDRFGRIWVGRAGGPGRPVRGAHTLGFNSQSTGVSVIGNFDTVAPSRATLNAIASLAAWKLARYERNPRGRVWVKSEGSDKFPAGRVVRLPVIDGHRDTNDTACPGGHLYQALPKIRRKAKRRIETASGEARSTA